MFPVNHFRHTVAKGWDTYAGRKTPLLSDRSAWMMQSGNWFCRQKTACFLNSLPCRDKRTFIRWKAGKTNWTITKRCGKWYRIQLRHFSSRSDPDWHDQSFSDVRGSLQSAFIGYFLDGKHNGKGYATKAVKLIVDYAFNELKLYRIEAGVMPHNKASIRMLEKAGFHKEGITRKNVKIKGKWEDHQVLAIIHPEGK